MVQSRILISILDTPTQWLPALVNLEWERWSHENNQEPLLRLKRKKEEEEEGTLKIKTDSKEGVHLHVTTIYMYLLIKSLIQPMMDTKIPLNLK